MWRSLSLVPARVPFAHTEQREASDRRVGDERRKHEGTDGRGISFSLPSGSRPREAELAVKNVGRVSLLLWTRRRRSRR